MQYFHMPWEPLDEKDLSNECLWVPANIRHEVGAEPARIVYGGVKINPEVHQHTPDDPQYVPLLNAAFFGDHQVHVGTQYLVAMEQTAQRVASEGEQVNLVFYYLCTGQKLVVC